MSTETVVRERPILFSGPMIRALLDGRKTQTRRVVTADNSFTGAGYRFADLDLSQAWADGYHGKPDATYLHAPVVRGPMAGEGVSDRIYPRVAPAAAWDQTPDPEDGYVPPASRLWVRETWGAVQMHELGQHVYGGPRIPDREQVVYRAGKQMGIPIPGTSPMQFRTEWRDDLRPSRWRPSIHMRREDSRLTLEITEVRVQRAQEISEADALAEGAAAFESAPGTPEPRAAFAHHWDSLNASRGHGWDSNPWVWCLSFVVLTPTGGASAG